MRALPCIAGGLVAAVLLAWCAPAFGQPGSPAVSQAGAPNAQDVQFVQALGADGMVEADAASLAGARAQNPQVRAYAQQVARDRTASNVQLAQLAQQAGIPAATAIDAGRQRKRQRLDASPAMQFDRDYVNGEAVDHQRTIQLLQTEINEGRSPQLRGFASAQLGMVMQHLAQARALQVQTAGRGGL
jgi:putative membrane protein